MNKDREYLLKIDCMFVLPPCQQLKDQDAKGPKVNSKVVSLVLDDLGSDVLGSADERVRLLSAHQLLSKTKVYLHRDAKALSLSGMSPLRSSNRVTHQFDITLHVQHQVLGLQVSVHDVLLMEVGVGLHHAGSAEHSHGLVKAASDHHTDTRALTYVC